MQTQNYTKWDQYNYSQLYSIRISLFTATFASLINKSFRRTFPRPYWITMKIIIEPRWTQWLPCNGIKPVPAAWMPTQIGKDPKILVFHCLFVFFFFLPIWREQVACLHVPGEGMSKLATLIDSSNLQHCRHGRSTQYLKETGRMNNVCKTAERSLKKNVAIKVLG